MNRVRSLLSLLLACLFLASVPAEAKRRSHRSHRRSVVEKKNKPARRRPLTERMNNPCALSWGYKSSGEQDPTSAFWMIQNAQIPVSKGDKDSRGNVVMKARAVVQQMRGKGMPQRMRRGAVGQAQRDAGAGASIARVAARARSAVAADDRHPHREIGRAHV